MVRALCGVVGGLFVGMGLMAALAGRDEWPQLLLVLAVLAAVAVGAAIGVSQGVLVAKLGLSAIMATLATLIWARGLTLAINDSRPIAVDGWLVDVANTRWAGFTIAAPLVIVAYVAGQWIRRRTKIGLYTAAIGGGPDAAFAAYATARQQGDEEGAPDHVHEDRS